MGSRKLVRDLVLSSRILHVQLQPYQVARARFGQIPANQLQRYRSFSVFDEFSKKLKGEVESNPEFQKTIKEFKEKAGKLDEAKEDLKERTKKTTEKLYKCADGVWTETEATAKKVSSGFKEKLSETFGVGKQGSTTSGNINSGVGSKDGGSNAAGEQGQKYEAGSSKESPYEWIKLNLSSASPKVLLGLQKLKDVKVFGFLKKGYEIVKDELISNPTKRRCIQPETPSPSTLDRSTRTDIVVVPVKHSRLGKKWEAFKEKMQTHPIYKSVLGISEPVVTKSQELAEDIRERWDTSDSPVVHKIQDINDTVFGESNTALSFKEIKRRDPSFDLPEFVAEVQEMIRPTLNALLKGDAETLKKNCGPEVIERCMAERRAYESNGIFFDNKILHISDLEVTETKLMGSTPIIIVAFQTQQIHCVRDRHGEITEGGKDTIHTVYYAWAMEQVDIEELGEGAFYPIWRLKQMQTFGVQALI